MSVDFIFIHGAPGTGKSSVAQALQQKLKSPCFEFGWIPEFRERRNGVLTYEEEEAFSFDNLVLVIKNYIHHGFQNVIVTDLRDHIIRQIPRRLYHYNYLLATLWVDDDAVLKSRVLNETRSSGYRDWQEALIINDRIKNRPLMRNEIRLDSTNRSIESLADSIQQLL